MSQPRVTIFPRSTSISFYPAIPNGEYGIGQASYSQLIQTWQAQVPYLQKIGLNDDLCIMVHTQKNDSILTTLPELYICDKFKTRLSYDLSVAPYCKGHQAITGNTWYNIDNGTTLDLLVSCWAFKFADFVTDGNYYLEFVNKSDTDADYSCFSEPLMVRADLPNTLLFSFYYNSNNDLKGIVNTNWYNDFPTDTVSYSPRFTLRCEGLLNWADELSVNINYLAQNYNKIDQTSQSFTIFDLKIGEISIGAANYVIQKVNEAIQADNLYIASNQFPTPKKYTLHLLSAFTQPTTYWKYRKTDARPLIYASCQVRYVSNSQESLVTPVPAIPTRIHTGVFSSVFN